MRILDFAPKGGAFWICGQSMSWLIWETPGASRGNSGAGSGMELGLGSVSSPVTIAKGTRQVQDSRVSGIFILLIL
ncbi:MAG TPA: hypothetical protein DCE41_36085 [Cytophagales bacterium]|nr:hypothetical protein [Cytophagales bacterium]HAA18762.1 hypothetical protein [Cytophagales bacterium]HAP62482.1 hypothetical protein [Cytophagales bacterium]